MKFRPVVILSIGLLLSATILFAQSPVAIQENEDFVFAEQLADKGMHDLAANQFQQYADKYSDSPKAAEALLRAGKSLEEIKEWTAAVSVYTRLLLNYPQSVLMDQGLFRRGYSFGRSDQCGALF